MKPKTHMRALLVLPALAFTGLCATAQKSNAATTINASVVTIMGTGIPDEYYVLDDNGAASGIRIRQRFQAPIPSDAGGTYTFVGGLDLNVDWHADSGASQLTNFTYRLYYDNDPSMAYNWSSGIDVTLAGDNSYGTDATLNGGGDEGSFAAKAPGNDTMQNSWRLSQFPFFGLNLALPGANYGLRMDVIGGNGVVSSAQANLQVVPEPSSALLGLGVIGGMLTRRRRK